MRKNFSLINTANKPAKFISCDGKFQGDIQADTLVYHHTMTLNSALFVMFSLRLLIVPVGGSSVRSNNWNLYTHWHQQLDFILGQATAGDVDLSRFLELERTVQDMLLQQGSQAIRIRNLEEDNEQLNGLVNDHSVQINVLVEEKQVLQATIQELEARVEELEARVDYVEAITRKDGKHFGLLK